MNKSESVEDLGVFKKSHQLVREVYEVTERFPKEEKFGLVPQMRRAAVSIPANLIEGSERIGRLEYRRFASIAKGSAGELKYYFLLARDLDYIAEGQYATWRSQVEEIGRMLNGLIKALSPRRP